ncbi:hypothetical protein RND71_016332 [Anisodus tanguticus]|uniref:Pectin acetylesterase n=1 Tax=Anisodus tanguticus TaxID=243964 RepID=A0AAE1VL86_9SOLA|nr:hypothetical protein RND71_016332 [Anisodus tanguticus]
MSFKRRALIFVSALLAVSCTTHVLGAGDALIVNITILQSATAQGAVCLDGSPPAYYLDRGHASGVRSWIIYLEGGGWCNTTAGCLYRSTMYLGSSKKMNQQSYFTGILYNRPEDNPEFYNWNRVKVKYCDGASFTGDVEQVDTENKLYFRGARIFKAIMKDLLSKGMQNAENAILSGSSAGGLATILNCDKFKSLLPNNARVKCVADAGFFIDGKTIAGTSYIEETYRRIVNLHGSAKNLPSACTSVMEPSLINNTLVPLYLDPELVWDHCKAHLNFGVEFLKTFGGLTPSFTRGYFITSCHTHLGILQTRFWFSPTSPRLLHKTMGEAVADWYFERAGFQYIDTFPCARDCKV